MGKGEGSVAALAIHGCKEPVRVMTLLQARDRLAELLTARGLKVVFAESCTGGLVSATMTQVPGISQHLCGSAVTYRPAVKQSWLDVSPQTMDDHTTESQQVAEAMVLGVLAKTPEAHWAAAIVGHFNDEAFVWISIARQGTDQPSLEVTYTRPLCAETRIARQEEATELVLTYLADSIAADSIAGD